MLCRSPQCVLEKGFCVGRRWAAVVCFTWDGQKKVPDTGLLCADIFIRIGSRSLERLLNLKRACQLFCAFQSLSRYPKTDRGALCEDSFLKTLALHFEWLKYLNKTWGPSSYLPQPQHQCHRRYNYLCKIGWGRIYVVLSCSRERFAPLHNLMYTGPSWRRRGRGWAFYPGQVSLLLGQSGLSAHSWLREKEQMQMHWIKHNTPTGQWALCILLYGCATKYKSAPVLNPRDMLFSESCRGLCHEGLQCNPQPWQGCLAAPMPPRSSLCAPELQAGAWLRGQRLELGF